MIYLLTGYLFSEFQPPKEDHKKKDRRKTNKKEQNKKEKDSPEIKQETHVETDNKAKTEEENKVDEGSAENFFHLLSRLERRKQEVRICFFCY